VPQPLNLNVSAHKEVAVHVQVMTRGPENGECNICGEHRKLTEDHIPPKGSVKITQVELLNIVECAGAPKPTRKGRLLQNGIRYRTICADCNNNKLGAQYDPVFNKFSADVLSIFKSPIITPPSIAIHTSPNKLAKAIIGHLLAFGLDRHRQGDLANACTDFFLGIDKVLSNRIKIYYWFFPYKNTVILKDSVFMPHYFNHYFCAWVLKSAPFGYMVTWDMPTEVKLDLPNLATYMNSDDAHEQEILMHYHKMPAQHFPETPSEAGAIMYGKDAIKAYPRVVNR
jgi:hypothetical protein